MEAESIPNFDVSEALNLDLLIEHILLLRFGKSIEKLVYDMRISEHRGTGKVAPKKLLSLKDCRFG
jgi:uridine kinase